MGYLIILSIAMSAFNVTAYIFIINELLKNKKQIKRLIDNQFDAEQILKMYEMKDRITRKKLISED